MVKISPSIVTFTLCILYFFGILPNFFYFARGIRLTLSLLWSNREKALGATKEVGAKVVDRFRVPLSDIDFNLHMNNQCYHNYAEQGRWRILFSVMTVLRAKGLGLALTGNTIRFRRELRFAQEFRVFTQLIHFDGLHIYGEARFITGENFVNAIAYWRCTLIKKGSKLKAPVTIAELKVFADKEVSAFLTAWISFLELNSSYLRPKLFTNKKQSLVNSNI